MDIDKLVHNYSEVQIAKTQGISDKPKVFDDPVEHIIDDDSAEIRQAKVITNSYHDLNVRRKHRTYCPAELIKIRKVIRHRAAKQTDLYIENILKQHQLQW